MEREEVADVFRGYGLGDEEIAPVLRAFAARPKTWVDFMMRFELGLEAPQPRRAPGISVTVTLVALLVFGYVKGRFTRAKPWRSGLQTLLVGGFAAAAAFALAKSLGGGA